MARRSAPSYLNRLYSLRVKNVPQEVSLDTLREEFRVYGAVGDIFRPAEHGTVEHPTRVVFVRFFCEDSAAAAILGMDGKELLGEPIEVGWAQQESFFTNATGFITNWDIVETLAEPPEFDPSMPDEHYHKKVEEELKHLETVHTVRVDDIHKDVTTEHLHEVFSKYGAISRIYFPMDLNSHTRKDFAFVRFVHEMSARRAIEALDGTVLIGGRCIRCTYVPPATRYFATDHLHTDDKRRYGKVKEQKRPTGVAMLL